MQLCGLFTEIVWCQVNMTYLVLITKDTFVYVAPASVGANSSSNFSPIKKFKRIDWTGRKNIEYFGLHWDSKKHSPSSLHFLFNKRAGEDELYSN